MLHGTLTLDVQQLFYKSKHIVSVKVESSAQSEPEFEDPCLYGDIGHE